MGRNRETPPWIICPMALSCRVLSRIKISKSSNYKDFGRALGAFLPLATLSTHQLIDRIQLISKKKDRTLRTDHRSKVHFELFPGPIQHPGIVPQIPYFAHLLPNWRLPQLKNGLISPLGYGSLRHVLGIFKFEYPPRDILCRTGRRDVCCSH